MAQLIKSLFTGTVESIKDYNGVIGDNRNAVGIVDSYFDSPKSKIVNVKGYGYLYNFPVLVDARGLVDSNFRVPLVADWDDLIAVLDADGDTHVNLLKSTSGWFLASSNLLNVPPDGSKPNNGLDKYNFNAKPSGLRWNTGTPNTVSTGNFTSWGTITRWWCADGEASGGKRVYSIDTSRHISSSLFFIADRHASNGFSVRFVRDLEGGDAGLLDGDYAADYTDEDGNVYKTVKIGNRVWFAENFYGTTYLNGDPVTELKTGWTNPAAPVYCVYNNAPHIVAANDAFTKTTKDLQTRALYASWDLTNLWNMEAQINNNYPYLI